METTYLYLILLSFSHDNNSLFWYLDVTKNFCFHGIFIMSDDVIHHPDTSLLMTLAGPGVSIDQSNFNSQSTFHAERSSQKCLTQ